MQRVKCGDILNQPILGFRSRFLAEARHKDDNAHPRRRQFLELPQQLEIKKAL